MLLRLAAFSAAFAVACAVAGLGLVGSFRHLIAHPRGYGTTWDASVTGRAGLSWADEEEFEDALAAVRASPDVEAAGGVQFDGLRVRHREVPIVAIWSLFGPPQSWSVITGGRAPRNDREVALGPKTMEALGLGIGDKVDQRSPNEAAQRLTVVGEALVYDGLQIEPGEGSLVDSSWFGSARDRVPDTIVLRASSPNSDWRPIEREGFNVIAAPAPPGVRNLSRIDRYPGIIAAIVGLLAVVALAYTMGSVARTEKKQLAVLRGIGFTRGQVAATLSNAALAIVALAVMIGIPVGLVAQQWIWSVLEEQIGFSSSWYTSWWPIVVIALALLLAAAVGAIQGWATSRRPAANALRAE